MKNNEIGLIHFCLDCDTLEERSNRVLKRAYSKYGFDNFIDERGYPFIIVYRVYDTLYELFTNKELGNYNDYNYQIISINELFDLTQNVRDEKLITMKRIIDKLFFDGKDIEISTMNELAGDRARQFDCYNGKLTTINPYETSYIDLYTEGNSSMRKIISKGKNR